MKKLFILPYFGELPEWIDRWKANFEETLRPCGYDYLIDTDLEGFKVRVKNKLDIEYPGLHGTGKVWDYRCTLGLLYEEEIREYEFYGHTDFDCVYGNVSKWITDEFLEPLAIHSNHSTYVNGCWSLYRNNHTVNTLFMKNPEWRSKLSHPECNGWVEEGFSRTLEASGLRYAYTFFQGWPYISNPILHMQNGKLYQDGEEIMMFHFRRSKQWPI